MTIDSRQYRGSSLPTREEPEVSDETLCGVDWLKSQARDERPRGWPRIRVADLFSGCGGFSLGVEEGLAAEGRRMVVAVAADANARAREVYLNNFEEYLADAAHEVFLEGPIEEHIACDLESLEGEALEQARDQAFERFGRIDIMVAGPPCQGHSNLNNHTRGKDARNHLYFSAVNFARLTRPRLVLIENVASAARSSERVVQRARQALKDVGYASEKFLLDAHEMGVAQTRKRLVVLAHRVPEWNEEPPWEEFERYDSDTRLHVLDVIEDLFEEPEEDEPEEDEPVDLFRHPPRITQRSKDRIAWLFEKNEDGSERYDLIDEMRPACHSSGHRYKSMYGRMKPDEPAQTITTGFGSMGQGRYVHPERHRLITPHEAARIQGFPDFFAFRTREDEGLPRRDLQRLIGNAVPPKIAAILVRNFIRLGGFTSLH